METYVGFVLATFYAFVIIIYVGFGRYLMALVDDINSIFKQIDTELTEIDKRQMRNDAIDVKKKRTLLNNVKFH